jgi:hypothetical protein
MPRMPVAALILLAAVCAIYLPDLGHGFIRDDAGWVGHNELSSWSDARQLFVSETGQFRPTVSLSFALERRACGSRPMCYGLTNFALLLACAGAVFVLACAMSLETGAAIAAAALWVFNWHGISSAVLWISGRSALMIVLPGTLAAAAFVRSRWLLAAMLTGVAMFSKEEAVMLPVALLAWSAIDAYVAKRPIVTRAAVGFAVLSVLLWIVYFLLRSKSGALTAATAPAYYRLDFSVARLLSNVPEYLDRSLTFTAAVLLVFWIASRPPVRDLRPPRALVTFAAVWWISGFAITMFIPVRSSLYACLPSVGFCVLGAAILQRGWNHLPESRRALAAGAGLVLPFVLWPVYHLRNKDLVDATDVSARTMAALQRVADRRGAGTVVVLDDDRSRRASIDTAFGTGLQQAADLVVTPRLRVWMNPPPADADLGGIEAAPARPDVRLKLENGQFVETNP